MDEFKKRGPKPGGKSFGAGGARKPYAKRESGAGGDRSFGERKPYAARDRAEGGERRPYAPRGDRPYSPRPPRDGSSSYGERKPYARREAGAEGGERRPYAPRGDRPYSPRPPRDGSSSYGERKPYAKREGGFEGGERRPYQKRESGFAPRGDRPYSPRPPREGGFEGGERRPYQKREGGERRPYTPRGDGERAFRPRREEGDYKPRDPRTYPDAPVEYTEGGRDHTKARDYRRSQRIERLDEGRPGESTWEEGAEAVPATRARRQVEFMHPQADGWLVGPHAVKAALKAGRRTLKELWVMAQPDGELATLLEDAPVPVVIKERAAFDGQFGDLVHQGIALQVGNLPQPELSDIVEQMPKLVVALDQVTDPHNVGAILRSCAAFGVGAVLMPERRNAPVTPVVAKAAAGGLEVVPVVEIVNLSQTMKQLKEAGYTMLGLAGEGTLELNSVEVAGPVCLVLGSEGDGLRRLTREGCDHLVRIPQDMGAVGSLNVSVAAGIALYSLTR